MTTNAQLRAEIQSLAQSNVRVPTNLPKFTGTRNEDVREWLFQIENACRIHGITISDNSPRLPGIAGSAMEKPAAGWFLYWSSTTPISEQTWINFREHALDHFEASNYQSALREKLQSLRQTSDIETYNGEYSSLIFRVEGMNTIDQVTYYTNGLKPKTRSYVKLEDPDKLSKAMDLANKYENTHFTDNHNEKNRPHSKYKANNFGHAKEIKKKKAFQKGGSYKAKPKDKFVSRGSETRTCHFCKKKGHIKMNCYSWKKEQEKQGNE
jgi:hypothetical protein